MDLQLLTQVEKFISRTEDNDLIHIYQTVVKQEDPTQVIDKLEQKIIRKFGTAKKGPARILEPPEGDSGEPLYSQTGLVYLLIIIHYYFVINDYKNALLISYYCSKQLAPDEIELLLQLKLVIIQCLEKLNQLERCLKGVEELVEFLIKKFDSDDALNKWLMYFLNKKSIYLKDFIENKKTKLDNLNQEERKNIGQKIKDLIDEHQKNGYYKVHGYPVYLISWPKSQWINRFSLYTNFYEINHDDDQILKQELQKKFSVRKIDEHEDYWYYFVKLLDDEDQITLQQLTEINDDESVLQIGPIMNDDILDLSQPLLVDSFKPKDYCNYSLKLNLKEDENFIIVSSQVWKYLFSIFGGLEVKRFINEINELEMKPKVELYPQEVRFSLFPLRPKKEYRILININETVRDFCEIIRRIFKNELIGSKMNVWQPLNQQKLKEFQESTTKYELYGSILKDFVCLNDCLLSTLVVELYNEKKFIVEKLCGTAVAGSPNLRESCSYCGKSQKLQYCQCMSVRYCNEECWKQDKKRHLNECKLLQAQQRNSNDLAKKLKVKPPVKFTSESRRGICGLSNLGNTCFMNSSLQCLSHVYEVTQFMLSNDFIRDLNEKNPLGSGGHLAAAYAELLKEMWSGEEPQVSPWNLKNVIGRFAQQFSGYSQQDSQELLSYLLDGLHEDLNRIQKKPYIPEITVSNLPDHELASLYWKAHEARNKSIITENFTGQYRSEVKCPTCKTVSVTFDLFLSLSLPIPTVEIIKLSFYLVFRDSNKVPQHVQLQMRSVTTVQDILEYVASKINKKSSNLKFFLLQNNTIERQVQNTQTIKQLNDFHGNLFLYEIFDPNLDDPQPEDQRKEGNLIFYLNIVDLKSRNKYHDHLTPLSFTRYFQSQNDISLWKIHLCIYKYMRPYLFQYFESSSNTRNLDDTLKNAIQQIFSQNKTLEQELEDILNMQEKFSVKPPYIVTYQSGNKLFPSNKNETVQTQFKINRLKDHYIDLQVQLTNYVKGENLKLNKCVESEFNLQQHAHTGYDLGDCLDMFCKEEVLGHGNEWYCSKCKEHKQAQKKMEIYKAPLILVLHLKRFKNTSRGYGGYFHHGGGSTSKITSFIQFPFELDLNRFVLSQGVNYKYDLFAVSNHFGGLGGGHYTAFAKNPLNNKWHDFNDSMVSSIKPQNIITENAYVLFYRRSDSQACQLSE